MYQSNTQIGPYKTETAPKKSEYASQFKGYRYQPVPKEPSEGPKKRAKVTGKYLLIVSEFGLSVFHVCV